MKKIAWWSGAACYAMCVLSMLTGGLPAQPDPVASAVVIVVDDDGPAQYRSIQEAVFSLPDRSGALIRVMPGVYRESVTVNRSGLSIEGVAIDGERPIVAPSATHQNASAFYLAGSFRADITISGIDCRGNGATSAYGVTMRPDQGFGLVLDDLLITGFRGGIDAQSKGGGPWTIRNCRIIDNAPVLGGHGQGLFSVGVSALTVENCVFDRNGWTASLAPTIFEHNAYTKGKPGVVVKKANGDTEVFPAVPQTNLIFRNNIVLRASSIGVSASADFPAANVDALIEGNVVAQCPNGIVVGSAVAGGNVRPRVLGNLLLDLGGEPSGVPQALGIEVAGSIDGEVVGNRLVGVTIDSGPRVPFKVAEPHVPEAKANVGLSMDENIVQGWPGTPEPTRTLGDYAASLGTDVDGLVELWRTGSGPSAAEAIEWFGRAEVEPDIDAARAAWEEMGRAMGWR